MTALIDAVLIGTVGIAVSLGGVAIFQAIRHPLRQRHLTSNDDVSEGFGFSPILQTKWDIGWPVVMLVLPLTILLTRDARTNVESSGMQTRARQEIQAAYDAAAQPRPALTAGQSQDTSIPVHGYVYVGQCDKQWIPNTRRFGSLPNCKADIPADGVKIISWKGDIIRDALPMGGQGQRQLGGEVGRVSAGYSVVLRKLIPTSLFPNGPQYYWGLVDLPNDMPKER